MVQNKLRTVKINYKNNRNTFFSYRLNIKRSSTKRFQSLFGLGSSWTWFWTGFVARFNGDFWKTLYSFDACLRLENGSIKS